MTRLATALAAFLLIASIVLLTTPAAGQDAGFDDATGAEEELARIHETLEEIVRLLEGQAEVQRLTLFASREEAAVRLLGASERELEDLLDRQDGLDLQEEYLERELRAMAERETTGESELSVLQLEQSLAAFESELALNQKEAKRLARRVGELYSKIAEQRQQAEIWRNLAAESLREIR